MLRRGWKTIGAALALLMVSVLPALAAGINSLPPVTVSPGVFPLADPGCPSTSSSLNNLWITQGNTPGAADFKIDALHAGYIFQSSTAPSCPFKYQLWWNTSTTPAQLQVYSGSAWTPIAYFDTTNSVWVPFIGGGIPTTIPSSSTTDICTTASPQALVSISGSTQINSFGSSCPTGVVKYLTFLGTPQVTYGASTIILPGAANLTPGAGDVWTVAYLGSGKWQLYNIQAATSVSGVISFNGRTGVVVPITNDYSFSELSGKADNAQLPTLAPVGVATNVAGSLASPNTSAVITADGVVVGTALGGTTYTLSSYNQTFNSANTGAGGMDTGALPTSGNVCIYAIYNPGSVLTSVLGVNCATSSGTIYSGSHIPTGYTASALLGFWPTNSSPAMIAGILQRANDRGCAPNIQLLTTGSGATYTTPTCNGVLPLAISVRQIGAGGGGGGDGGSGTGTGGTGGTTTFNSITTIGGSGGTGGSGGGAKATGGIGGSGGAGSVSFRIAGNGGASGFSNTNFSSGSGGGGPWGGAGRGTFQAAAAAGGSGQDAVVNSGAGGAGAASGTGSSCGGGGGAGEYAEYTITSISTSYTYTIGAAGTAGSGTAAIGGAGGSGVVVATATWH